MSEAFTFRLRSAFDAITPANDAATAWLEARQVPADAVFLTNLALEELVTNCVKYGYDDAREHTIDVELSVADHELSIVVVDDGHGFNPLEAPVPDLTLPIMERPIGGLGIHLLKELSDHMTYERRDGTNRVTLTKRFD